MKDEDFIKTFEEKLDDLVFFIVKNLSTTEKKELIEKFNDRNTIGEEGIFTTKQYDLSKISYQNAFLTLIIKNYLIYSLVQISIKTNDLLNLNPIGD